MKKTNLFLLSLLSCLLLALMACQHATPRANQKSDVAANAQASSPESNLTQAEADARSQAVTNPAYDLLIDLDEKTDSFHGRLIASFDLKTPAALFLDLQDGAQIQRLSVNTQTVATPNFSRHRVWLPVDLLKAGHNQIEITYLQNFSHNGRGLHRFRDPEDQRIYLYTQFEAFDAHQMFPCFDQPDLKAKMTLTVSAPKDWEVITTTRETGKTVANDRTIWSFAETPKMSTYLFSLHAGPYQKWQSQAGKIPLRLFARRSLARFVTAADWFTPTQQGLKFYGDYFACAYPFKKYDQIIAPDFNAGAMENIAAITFSERFVHRGAVTREDREHLAGVILHEMAHMWFGDLVTMQWWNGLWLNESFATFMSALAMDRATEFNESWLSFYSGDKSRAYFEDQLVTTHPIDGNVPDTNSAFTNFDGITYGKGASVLKQLKFYLGDDVFRDGVRYYFKTHAYSNTKLSDFIGALEHASNKELSHWSDSWLREAGLDSVRPHYTCADGRITDFTLELLGPDGQASPRVHRTQVALYRQNGAKISAYKTVSVEYRGLSTEVPMLKGQACPALIDPNDQDQDYGKSLLDPQTLQATQTQLSKIQSPFVRTRLWSALFQMVRDGALSPQDYLKIAAANLPAEKDLKVAEEAARHLSAVFYYLPARSTDDAVAREKWIAQFEKILWTFAASSSPKSDWQKQVLQRFIDVVQTSGGRDQLIDLLNGKLTLKGFTLDPDQRWSMIVRLSSLGDERVASILTAQREQDKSERGIQMGLAADASRPSLGVKQKLFQQSVEIGNVPFARERATLRTALPPWQDSLRAALAKSYYDNLPRIVKTKDAEFLRLYASAFLPATCSNESVHAIGVFLNQHADLPPTVIKTLKAGRQEDERCVQVRSKAAN